MLSPTEAIQNVLANEHLDPKDFKGLALRLLWNTRPGSRERRARKRCPTSKKYCEEYRDCHKKNYCWLK